MDIKPGAKVYLIHSKELGYVHSVDLDGFCQVLVDNEVIPVPKEGLEIYSAEKHFKRKVATNHTANESQLVDKKLFEINNSGLQLVVIPHQDAELGLLGYSLALYNDTNYWIAFEFSYTNSKQSYKHSGLLKAGRCLQFARTPADFFAYQPFFEATFWQNTTQGNENETPWKLKPKAKKLAQPSMALLEFDTPVVLYPILHTFKKDEQAEDLSSYTKKNISATKTNDVVNDVKENAIQLDPFNVWERANYPTEIDLHIETLFPDTWRTINPKKYLELQLDALEEYLYKAFMLGIDSFYIIHGNGQQILKNSVARRLEGDPNVASYVNAYHPKYGHGATEVITKKN